MKVKVVPGILEKTKEEVEKKVGRLKGVVDEVMVDVIDGKMAGNKTVGVEELENVGGEISLGVQLMTEEPIEQVEACAEVGTELIIGQIELMESQKEFVKAVKELKMKPGLGLDLKTGIEFLEEEVLDEIEEVLLMAVPVGWSGQKFDKQVLEKIKSLREMGYQGNLWVDGGINEATIKDYVKAGANRLSVTSAIWESSNIKQQIKKLSRLARGAFAP